MVHKCQRSVASLTRRTQVRRSQKQTAHGYQVVSGPHKQPNTLFQDNKATTSLSGGNTIRLRQRWIPLGRRHSTNAPFKRLNSTEDCRHCDDSTTIKYSVNGHKYRKTITGAAFAAYGDSVRHKLHCSSTLDATINDCSQRRNRTSLRPRLRRRLC